MALFLKNQGQKRKPVKDDIVGPTQKRLRLSSSDNDVDGSATEEDNISPSSEEPLVNFSTPDSQHALNDRDEMMSSFKDHVQVNESSTQPFQTPFNDNSEKECQNAVDMDICKTKDNLVNVPSFEERSLIEGKETVNMKTATDDISSGSSHSTDDDVTDKDIVIISKSQSILNNESIEDQSSHETNDLLLYPSFKHVFHDHCYSRPYHSTSDKIISKSTMEHNTIVSTSVNDVESQDLFSEARETTRVSPVHDTLSKEVVDPSPRKLDKNALLCEKHLVNNSDNRADNVNISTDLTTSSPDIETTVTNTVAVVTDTVAMEICQSDATNSDLGKQTANHYVAANLVNSNDFIADSSDNNVPTETSPYYYQTKITPITASDDTPVNKNTCIETTPTTSKTIKETKNHISEDELIIKPASLHQKEANRFTMSTELSLPSLNKEPLSLSKLTESLSALNVSLSLVMESADPVELERLAKVCSQFVHLYLEHR